MAKISSQKAKKKIPQKLLSEWLENYEMQTRTRFRMAKDAYEIQDGRTKEAIDRIRDRLVLGATGLIRLPNNSTIQVQSEIVQQNALWVAVEIMKDLAMFDIKVADFQFPTAYCADCGVSLRPRKKKNRGR